MPVMSDRSMSSCLIGAWLMMHGVMSHRSMESCLMMDGIKSDDGWSPMIESRLTRMMDGVMSDDGWSHV